MATHTRTAGRAKRAPQPRRDLTRLELALRGLAVAVVVVLVLALLFLRGAGAFGGPPEVAAEVENAGGSLGEGSDVKVLGVVVGEVTDITRADGGGVRVGMRIDESEIGDIPANVEARILPATVFGTSYLDLVVRGTPAADALADGATVPADTSVETLELQQALDDIDSLVRAVGPAELQLAISSAAEALEGRGERIGEIMELADSYLTRLQPRLPLLRSDLEKLSANLDLVDRLAPDFLTATEDALVTFTTITSQRAAIAQIVLGGTELVQDGRALLEQVVPDAVRFLDNGVILLDILYDNREVGITDAIRTNIVLGQTLPTNVERKWLRSDAIVQLGAPDFYGPEDRPDWGGGTQRSQRPVPSLRTMVQQDQQDQQVRRGAGR
jgi:virulence factor Mce-like protein